MFSDFLIKFISSLEYKNILFYSICESDGKTIVKFNDSIAEVNHMNHIVYEPTEKVLNDIFTNIQTNKEQMFNCKLNKKTTLYFEIYTNRVFFNVHQFDIKETKMYNKEDDNICMEIQKLLDKYKEE